MLLSLPLFLLFLDVQSLLIPFFHCLSRDLLMLRGEGCIFPDFIEKDFRVWEKTDFFFTRLCSDYSSYKVLCCSWNFAVFQHFLFCVFLQRRKRCPNQVSVPQNKEVQVWQRIVKTIQEISKEEEEKEEIWEQETEERWVVEQRSQQRWQQCCERQAEEEKKD